MADVEDSRQYEDVRVLILEDNPVDAELLEYELKGDGFVFSSKLVATRNAYTEALREYHPDIILSDYDLPGFSGPEALQIKKEQSPETPFILVSGVVTEERAIEILTGGATDYVLKKNLSRLLPAIHRALHETYEHRKRREAEAERDHLLNDLEKMVRDRTNALQIEIEERRRIEEELRRSMLREQKRVLELNAVINGMTEGMIIADVMGKVLLINKVGASLLGYADPGEYIGQLHKFRETFEFSYPDGTQMPYKEWPLRRVLKGEILRNYVARVKRLNTGRELYLSYNGSLIYDLKKTIPFFALITFRDVTEVKQTEESLRKSQEELKRALESSEEAKELYRVMGETIPYGIWMCGSRGEQLYASQSFLDLLGTSLQGLNRTGLVDRLPPEDVKPMLKKWRHSLRTGEPWENVFRIHGMDKKLHYVLAKGLPVRNKEGEITAWVGINLDIDKRIEIEKALQEGEERLRVILDAAELGTFDYDPATRVLTWDETMKRIWGIPENEVIDFEEVVSRIHPADHPKVQEALRSAMDPNGDGEYLAEYRIVWPDGSVHWTTAKGRTYFEEKGARRKPLSMTGVAQDITERKEHERAVQENESRLKLALQAAGQGTWELEIPSGNLTFTEKSKAQFGLGPDEEVTLDLFLRLVHPEDRERMKKAVTFVIQSGRHYHEEFRVVWPNQDVHWIEGTGEVSFGDKGERIRLSGVMRDITQFKEAQETLLKQKLTLDALMGATSDYIFMIDREKRYLYANPRALGPLGVGLDTIIGKTWRDLGLDAEVLVPFVKEIDHVLGTGKARRGETVYPAGDGPHTYEYEINPVTGEKGEVEAVAISARDITGRKRTEEQLAEQTVRLGQANRELEAFIYSVSHDLQGPVRAMDGFANMILKEYGDKLNEDLRRKFDVIRENSKLMGDLIQGLLSLSRIGRTEISISMLNMEDLFENVWHELKTANPGRQIELLRDELAPAWGDKSLIRQVFYNLLANAIKFTQRRKKAIIRVGSFSEKGRITYYVKDNGAGFDMQYYDKLFRVFQRLHTTSEFQGTGIGLAIVQRILKRHGGEIWAEGKKGEGAAFYFSLPTVQK